MQEQTYKIELLKRNLWLLGSVLILGIAFSIFLYKWYKRRKDLQLIEARYQLQLSEKEVAELKMHQQELELQNVHNALATSRQEATSFAVFLKSRNELLDKIRGMVKEGYKMDAQAITPHLKKINAFISQSQSGDKTNSALLTNIDDKSNEFLQRLVAIHPKLTQGEKYLATLLRVNLSTKEISMLTGLPQNHQYEPIPPAQIPQPLFRRRPNRLSTEYITRLKAENIYFAFLPSPPSLLT